MTVVMAADASPEAWQQLMGVAVDTHRHVNLLLAGSPMFKQIHDLLAGGLQTGVQTHISIIIERRRTAAPTRSHWPFLGTRLFQREFEPCPVRG